MEDLAIKQRMYDILSQQATGSGVRRRSKSRHTSKRSHSKRSKRSHSKRSKRSHSKRSKRSHSKRSKRTRRVRGKGDLTSLIKSLGMYKGMGELDLGEGYSLKGRKHRRPRGRGVLVGGRRPHRYSGSKRSHRPRPASRSNNPWIQFLGKFRTDSRRKGLVESGADFMRAASDAYHNLFG